MEGTLAGEEEPATWRLTKRNEREGSSSRDTQSITDFHSYPSYSSSQKQGPDIQEKLPIPLPGIYLKKRKILTGKDMCTSMFTAAVLTSAKIGKQPVVINE